MMKIKRLNILVFFAALRPQSLTQSGTSISADLENTLKKLIEQQEPRSRSLGTEGPSRGESARSSEAGGEGQGQGGDPGDSSESFSNTAGASEQSQANQSSQSAAQGEGASQAPAGETNQLQERIKELEARLSEYEIIAEDIADLSFYKEENHKLQKEIDEIKNKGTSGTAATTTTASASPSPAPSPAPPAPAAQDPAPAPVAAPSSTPTAASSPDGAMEPASPVVAVAPLSPEGGIAATTQPAVHSPATSQAEPPSLPPQASAETLVETSPSEEAALINPDISEVANAPGDEDLLKEFEDIVGAQQPAPLSAQGAQARSSAETSETAKATETTEATGTPEPSSAKAESEPPKNQAETHPAKDENAELLNQFENFVKKS